MAQHTGLKMVELSISQKTNKIIFSLFIFVVLSNICYAKNSKILFLIGEPYSSPILHAINNIDKKYPKIYVKKHIDFVVVSHFKKIDKSFLRKYHVFLVDIMYPATKKIISMISNKKKIISLRGKHGGYFTEKRLIFDNNIIKYFLFPSPSNTENLLKYVLNKELNVKISYKKPEILPKIFIAHPYSDKFFTNIEDYLRWYKSSKHFKKHGFWVAITYYSSMVNNTLIKKLVQKFEANNINVMVVYGFPAYMGVRKFLLPHKVDFIIGISYKFSASLDDNGKNTLKELNVPVYNVISLLNLSKNKWELSKTGLTPFEVSFQISIPELGGIIEPTVISSKEKRYNSSVQKYYFQDEIIDYQVDWLINRIKAMRRLQIKENKYKKIAIIYYNHHPGKQNIGASYLNVMKSLSNILINLRKQGYNIGENIKLDYETLKNAMLLSGRNVGNYAKGEIQRLVDSKKVVLLPISKYKEWIKDCPENFIAPVMEKWGAPEDSKIMVYKGNFIIPMVKISDNVIILPQPSRGWGQDPIKMYHDVTLPPHHQYVAVYLWLKNKFKADAIINLGTHGTHEWMPGKQAGTIYWDNGDYLVQDIPVLYPYVMDDIGEAIQAKRRGRGIILSHLTPVIKKGNLFDKYLKLEEKLNEYEVAKNKNSRVTEEKLLEIKRLVKKTGIDRDLKIKKITEESLEDIEHYLIDLKQQYLPYGLHTYGKIQDKGARDFAKTLAENYKDISKDPIKYFYSRLKQSAQLEIKNLINGLNGRYIPPGHGNDPIRSPDSLPTGRNLYAFDSSKIPSKEAYKVAKRLVDESLEKYKTYHGGRYPEKVEVILWSVETCRDEGINISQALYYMGIKPVWDSKGRVIGVIPISGKVLQRPRIDVLMQPSGLFRDMFPNIIQLLDDAVKMAQRQKDIENFIAAHSKKIEVELIKKGVKKTMAEKLAGIRIFGAPPSAYGTMVAELTGNSGMWDNSTDIAEVYINRLSYGYSRDFWGKPLKNIFKTQLKDVDVVVHSLSTNLYGTMDNDDFFQYAGGAVLAVRTLKGKSPELYVARSADPKNSFVEDISRTIGKEFRIRYTNPEWIRAMMKEGYAGAREMSKFVEYMWGWQVTVPSAVDDVKWKLTYNVYVKDSYKLNIKEFFEKQNPWAYQSITARMLEAVRKGYWKPNKKIIQKLAVEYVTNVVKNGVACCDHTCNNPMLNQMVVNIVSIPGVLSPKIVEKFKAILSKALGKTIEKQLKERKKLLKRIGNIIKDMKNKNVDGKINTAKKIKGFELKEETKKEDSELSSSGVQWYLMALVGMIIFVMSIGTITRHKTDRR